MADDLANLIDAFMKQGIYSHITMNMGANGPVVALRGARDAEYSRDQLRGQKASVHLRAALEGALKGKRRAPKAADPFDDILGI